MMQFAPHDLGGLMASLFVAGMAGGFAHCIGMCGPFVMAQVSAGLEKIPADSMGEMHRLTGGLLVPYHLGRMTTYVALGAAAAAVSGNLAFIWDLRILAFVLLAFAALFFTVQGLKGLGVSLPQFLSNNKGASTAPGLLNRLAKPFFQNPTGHRGYLLGVVLGFLPCGLVYGALAAAGAAGDALAGAMVMGAFALGTVPALMAAGVLGQLAAARMRDVMRMAGPVFLFFSSGFLIYMAWRVLGAA